jgi:hypothetical protein
MLLNRPILPTAWPKWIGAGAGTITPQASTSMGVSSQALMDGSAAIVESEEGNS